MIPKIGPTDLPARDDSARRNYDPHAEPFTVDVTEPPTRNEAARNTRRSERATADYPAVDTAAAADGEASYDGLDDADTDLDFQVPDGGPVALAVPLDPAVLEPIAGGPVAVAAQSASGSNVWVRPGVWSVPGPAQGGVAVAAVAAETAAPTVQPAPVAVDATVEETLAQPQADPRVAKVQLQRAAAAVAQAAPEARVTPQPTNAGVAIAASVADPATSEVMAGAGRALTDMGTLLRQTLGSPRRQTLVEPARPELAAASGETGGVDAARLAAQKVTAANGVGVGTEVAEALRNLGKVDGPTVLHLHSADIGRFSAVVRMDGGELFVSLRADDAQTRALLNAKLDDVREQLDNAGVHAAGVDVSGDGGGADDDARGDGTEVADEAPRPRRIIPKRARPQAPPRPRSGTHLDLLI